jgi:S-adenosylmethionine:tRNA ribosyltransferase-isomerase
LFLRKNDTLVLNDTKVFKARLFGKREGFEGKIEVLLTDKIEDNLYAALCSPSRRFKEGTRILFGEGRLNAEVVAGDDNFRLLRFDSKNGNLHKLLDEIGEVPLPPYVKRSPDASDEERYQTIYAKNRGAIAAPTAGLHFTEKLINGITASGVDIAYITLHVGYATFKPVKEEDITKHKMHRESYEIPKEASDVIDRTRNRGGRLVCVGTTSCRALESFAVLQTTISSTALFIYPGYKFKMTDALLTNFHLPRTTLLMLVSAFAGRDNIMRAYNEAIDKRYRFFSYGDAMLIV